MSMSAKTAKPPKALYTKEDLEPRDVAADEAALDAWLERNKDAINASADKAREEFERGEYYTHEEVWAEIWARLARRP
jgi:predicted transcriptional regulator